MSGKQKLGTLLYLGDRLEIWVEPNQSKNFVFYQNKFWVNTRTAANSELINLEYDMFCETKLSQIIEKGIERLRSRKIKIQLDYTDGKTTFKKDMVLSVDEYLKLIDYSKKIDFKIGAYKKEWGINQIDVKQKNFVLFFNLDLIKFDAGDHINYVVAHELAHIFHRDHGSEFNSTLEKLFPSKRNSENFFDFKIPQLLNPASGQSNNLIIFLIVLLLAYGVWSIVSQWFAGIFTPPVKPTF
jgi:predicted metal-dependent hydrolase